MTAGVSNQKDLGAFLCWGVLLTFIPLFGMLVPIGMIVIMTMELIQLQSAAVRQTAKNLQYASIHPAILIVAMVLLMPVFHPLFMHWRNKSGLFQPQPYAVVLSISVTVISLILGVVFMFFYLRIFWTAISSS